MIFYAITNATTEATHYIKSPDTDRVYDYLMSLTNDHGTAEEASSWCELASIDELYEHDQFSIMVVEIDE